MGTEILSDMQKTTLDPSNWDDFRTQSHLMLDDMLSYIENIRLRPVWQPIPNNVRQSIQESIPLKPSELSEVHDQFMKKVLPYAVGNVHPAFMGWVHGGGTPVGMLAEMLSAGLNANLGGRDQMPIEIEKQVVRWMIELFEFPENSSGIFVAGTSMANFMSVLIARTNLLGREVRETGLLNSGRTLIAYTSEAAHGCIKQAIDIAGIGTDSIRFIPVNNEYQMDVEILRKTIAEDKKNGLEPFFIAATAGTVDVGAIDDLETIASIAKKENIWFHVDGAYGALGLLAEDVAPKIKGIHQADSIAFDFHKWGQVPYDAGFILVRNRNVHLETFSSPATYLSRENAGMSAGSPWPCDFGPDLSRSFRALKTWFTFKTYGKEKIGEMISDTCKLAQYLKTSVVDNPNLELMSPVELNIVCFRFKAENSDEINKSIVIKLQESGICAPSTTTLNGSLAIRVAFVNHRTNFNDVDALIEATVRFGKEYESSI